MSNAHAMLDRQYHEMRWRALSLAADIDRLQRAPGGAAVLDDPRIEQLREAMRIVMSAQPRRAERVQMLFSDLTPLPVK